MSAITLKGKEGIEKIGSIMTYLRENPLTGIGDYKVVRTRDYLKDTITDAATGKTEPTGLPKSNVLYYELNDDAWICVRPSGTEPKIKFYYGIKGSSFADADQKSAAMAKSLEELADKLTK